MSALVSRSFTLLSKPLFARGFANVKSCLDRTEVSERIMNVVKGFDFVDASKVTPVTHFASDLNLDSIEIKTIRNAVKAEFCIDGCLCDAMSVNELTACISTNPRAK